MHHGEMAAKISPQSPILVPRASPFIRRSARRLNYARSPRGEHYLISCHRWVSEQLADLLPSSMPLPVPRADKEDEHPSAMPAR